MEDKTKAIVINSIKFGDSDLIVTCYTQLKGIKTYLVRGVLKSKKGKLKKSYFQPLTQLQLVARHNDKGNLNSIKEATISHFYTSIHSDIKKQTIALFLAEMLYHSIKEEEENTSLYDFLETSLLWLDTHDSVANFHILFLINLTKYLGFYPDYESDEMLYFDMLQGKYTPTKTPHTLYGKKLFLFKSMLGTNFEASHRIDFSAGQRNELLQLLIEYYKLHIDSFMTPKSLAVLKMVFS
ncbi:MAG: DNA repair protein RecO [Flavobacteriaceae bacterium]|nr:DNA repair protein RecO [Flavobacteriaceae bacterium]